MPKIVIIDTVKTPKGKSLSDVLRAELRREESLNAVAKATGLTRQSLSRFMRAERSLRLDLADKLAAHFGLQLRKGR